MGNSGGINMKFFINNSKIVKIDTAYTKYKKWYAWYPVKVIHSDNETYHYVWLDFVKKRLCLLFTYVDMLFINPSILFLKFSR